MSATPDSPGGLNAGRGDQRLQRRRGGSAGQEEAPCRSSLALLAVRPDELVAYVSGTHQCLDLLGQKQALTDSDVEDTLPGD